MGEKRGEERVINRGGGGYFGERKRKRVVWGEEKQDTRRIVRT